MPPEYEGYEFTKCKLENVTIDDSCRITKNSVISGSYGVPYQLVYSIIYPYGCKDKWDTPEAVNVISGLTPSELGIEIPTLPDASGLQFLGWSQSKSGSMYTYPALKLDTPLDIPSDNTGRVIVYSRYGVPGYAKVGTLVRDSITVNKNCTTFCQSMYKPSNKEYRVVDISYYDDGTLLLWNDAAAGCTYWWSESNKFYLNKNSNSLFSRASLYFDTVNVNNFDASMCDTMDSFFSGLSYITEVDLTGFNLDRVTSVHGLFRNCPNLSTVNFGSNTLSNVTSCGYMFADDKNLQNINTSNLDMSSITDCSALFENCVELLDIDASFITSNSIDSVYGMFYRCNKLRSINISNLDTIEARTFDSMFRGCPALETITYGENFKPNAGIRFTYMFGGSSKAPRPTADMGWTGTWNSSGTYTK